MRAVQTAGILADRSGLSITVEDGLREFDCGVIEGKSDPESWYNLRQVSAFSPSLTSLLKPFRPLHNTDYVLAEVKGFSALSEPGST